MKATKRLKATEALKAAEAKEALKATDGRKLQISSSLSEGFIGRTLSFMEPIVMQGGGKRIASKRR